VYQYPLFTEGYQNAEMDRQFYADLSSNTPKLIIVTDNPATPIEKYKSILNNYTLVSVVGYNKWKIYQKMT
jgi:hypothetical protein